MDFESDLKKESSPSSGVEEYNLAVDERTSPIGQTYHPISGKDR